MPGGETEKEVSAWTVDSLHEYMNSRFEAIEQRFEAKLKGMEAGIEDLKDMLQERYETQTKAIETAFIRQETAMQTALTAAEKAVQTALSSAEKAVDKAEVANEKRFESVNEFRGQLADTIRTFPSKAEVDIRFHSFDDKLRLMTERLEAQLLPMSRYVSREQGKSAGIGQAWVVLLGAIGAAATLIAILFAIRPG